MWSYFKQWEILMESGIFNIVSHKSIVKGSRFMPVVHWIIVAFAILWLWNFVRTKNTKYRLLSIIFILYTGFLFLYVNYSSYLYNLKYYQESDPFSGVQGRYIFPVLACFGVLFAYNFLNIFKNKYLKFLIFLILTAIFIYGDFVYFVKSYKKWYFDNPWFSYELGNSGPIEKGKTSLMQEFSLSNEKNEIMGIGVYTSTYSQIIKDGFSLNLYKPDCNNLVDSYPIADIRDNFYFAVKFKEPLKKESKYCFNIENKNSDKPITLWFSGRDLDGNIHEDFNKEKKRDFIYDLLETDLFNKSKYFKFGLQ